MRMSSVFANVKQTSLFTDVIDTADLMTLHNILLM